MAQFDNAPMEKAESSIEQLIENLNTLENAGWLSDQDMNELAFYLRRVIDIVGMQIDIDQYNDQYIANAAE